MENFKRLLKYIKPYKFLILLALFCAFVSNIAVIVATYLNGKAIDNIVGINNVNFKGLTVILITLAVIYIVITPYLALFTQRALGLLYSEIT